MDEFPGLLARDFGFRPQGKAAPMSASKAGTAGIGSGAPVRSLSKPKSAWSSTPAGPGSILDGHEGLFSSQTSAQDYGGFADVFGGPPRYTSSSESRNTSASAPPFSYDSVFQGSKDIKDGAKSTSLPVYDKPVYDDDVFEGVPGLNSSASVKYNDVFASMSSAPANPSSAYDDLLGNLGRSELGQKGSTGRRAPEREVSAFDDLIPGFGGSQNRGTSERNKTHQSSAPSTNSTSPVTDNPFVVLESTAMPAYSSAGLFTDPPENGTKPSNSSSSKADNSSVGGGLFDEINVFDGLTNNKKEKNPLHGIQNSFSSPTKTEPAEKPSTGNIYRDSNQTLFDMPTGSSDSYKPANRNGSRAVPEMDANISETNPHGGMSPKSDGSLETTDDIWLTVSEIPLFTQPTTAPPPARPPPRPPVLKADFNTPKRTPDVVKSPPVYSVDELEEFVMGRPPQSQTDDHLDVLSGEEDMEANSGAAASAAAMKEAMDRAEAKFKHAKEVREREKDSRAARGRDSARSDADDRAIQDALDRDEKLERLEREREREQKEHEEKEREQRRVEKEREERMRARHAVEMVTREARERASAEARLRAERAAVEKANAEARIRAERAAVQRASAEARERAAADAREKAEREARERAERTRERAERDARERQEREAKERMEREAREKEARERAAVERAAAEVRTRAERAAVERAQAEARERAAAAAREKQQKNDNDLESFFSMGARPNSAPKQRATSSDPFDTQFQSKGSDAVRRTSVGTTSSMRKASSTTNIVDDLSSIFGAAPSSEDFQEIEGENDERRRARLERHQRTLERAKKALAEKNERDIQTQRDQAERHRIAETLDVEIKRWAAGKEGNLRALLSTLQYVLWPECGWQPVSLTDLITGASVKKVYRKATLCIHPDKVQQKGANLQQKYVAEKVFDLLKEAWNKFNSEELF
ncbi:auxilin-related protein 2-like isoform X2 [Aristolochia californica]|uniref:auxilin-related protein 2-like isoform X2 n=1 Tax=Aristolochia californica TaxID=171875 RepID=UPI0035DFA699